MKIHKLIILILAFISIFTDTFPYRIDKILKLPSNPKQISILDDNLLVIVYNQTIQAFGGTHYNKSIYKKQTSNQGKFNLKSIKKSIFYLQNGKIKQIDLNITKQYDQYQTFIGNYKYGSNKLVMQQMDNYVIVQPTLLSFKALKIDIYNFNVTQIKGQNQNLTSYVSSNLVTFKNDTYYFTKLIQSDKHKNVTVYKGVENKINQLFTFIYDQNFYDSQQIILEIIQQQQVKQTYYYITVPLTYRQYKLYIYQVNESSIQKAFLQKSKIILDLFQSGKYFNKNSYVYYNYEFKVIDRNPYKKIEYKESISNQILINTYSKNRTFIFGVSKYQNVKTFYKYGYIFGFNKEKYIYEQINIIEKSKNGQGFNKSCFSGSDKYLILQQMTIQPNYLKQISFYNLQKQNFIESIIQTKLQTDSFKYFCSNNNTQNLFIVINQAGKTKLKFYIIDNVDQSIIFLHQLEILLQWPTAQLQFACLGQQSFLQFQRNSTDNYMLKVYYFDFIKLQIKLIYKKIPNFKTPSSYSLIGVSNNMIIFHDSKTNFPIYFLDLGLNQIKIQIKKLGNQQFQIADITQKYLLIKQTSFFGNYFHLLQFTNNNVKHLGLFDQKDNNNQPLRYFLIDQFQKLYIEYSYPYRSIYYDLNSPIKFKGYTYYTYDQKNKLVLLRNTEIYQKDNKTFLIGSYTETDRKILKYDITSDDLVLIDELEIDNNVLSLKTSSNKQQVTLVFTTLNQVQVLNLNNLSDCKCRKKLSKNIQNADFLQNGNLITLYNNHFQEKLQLYYFYNQEKQTNINKIIKQVNLVALSEKNIAYTGIDSQSINQSTYFIYHPFYEAQNYKKVQIGCPIKYLQYSLNGSSIAGFCLQSIYFVYFIQSQKLSKFDSHRINTQLKYFNESTLFMCFQGYQIKLINIFDQSYFTLIKTQQTKDKSQYNQQQSGLIFAIDYKNQIIALLLRPHNVLLVDNTLAEINSIYIPQILISNLAFNNSGQLYITANDSKLYIWTLKQCPQNTIEINYTCQCKQTFKQINQVCVCPNNMSIFDQICSCPHNFIEKNNTCLCPQPFVLDDRFCQCPQNSFYESSNCKPCSAFCLQCSNQSLFECDQFNALFFILILVLSLILIFISVYVFYKIKKCRYKRKECQIDRQTQKKIEKQYLL